MKCEDTMPSIINRLPDFAREPIEKMSWNFRKTTASKRVKPDFIIIGAQKAGTTSLFYYLSQHPHLKPSFKKEVHYFDGGLNPDVETFKKGDLWYRAHFHLKGPGSNHKAFEASPSYIFNPNVPERISEYVPGVKLIALLRDPVERALSQYFHEKRLGFEYLPLMEAVINEEKRLNSVLEIKDYKSEAYIHYTYKKRGLYKEQLERYLKYFPSSHILTLKSNDLFKKPQATLAKVFDFLGVDSDLKIKDIRPRKVAGNKTEVDSIVRNYLKDYFKSHNEDLYDLIGEDFGW